METNINNTTAPQRDTKLPVTRSQFLVSNGVYMELEVGQKFCFKFQPKGKPIIMCSHIDKETAAQMMIEHLKIAGIDFV